MMPPAQSQPRLAFGPFEVYGAAGVLLKSGVRIRLSSQPSKILLILLSHPGEAVTSEQLREQIWKKGTFVDFEHGLHVAVNKLRGALSDSAENPRYIETVPGRGYRFIGSLERPHSAPIPSSAGLAIQEKPPRRRNVERRWWLAAIAACVALSFAAGGWLYRQRTEPIPWDLTRLTANTGFSGFPALSPDGRLLAYSSDQGSDDGVDLYIKEVSGGPSIRLTSDGEGNRAPDFSPDGAKIVFRSDRDGGGIYEIPTLGGEVRFVVRDGLDPKFSPEGSQVAYWVGDPEIALPIAGTGAVFVVPAAGGAPRRVGANFTAARHPIWSRDGKHLLLIGYASAKSYDDASLDWWHVALNGEGAVKTGANERLAHERLRSRKAASTLRSVDPWVPTPASWSAADDTVIFSMPFGDTENLWKIGVSPVTGKVTGELRRLTTGAGNEISPSRSPGDTLTFAKVETRTDVWSLPVDLDRGRSAGALERITQSPAYRYYVSLSSNGRDLAFSSTQAGGPDIWIHDLESGKESRVASSLNVQRFPVISTSGAKVAYSAHEKGKRVVYISAPGGAPEKLCEGCLRATDWSRDDKTLLVFGGSPEQINALDVASHRQTPILKHPKYNLLYGRLSSDNRWVSFTVRTEPGRAHVAIAPLDVLKTDLSNSGGFTTIPESAWIHIADVGLEDWADWSPDGRTLYFTSMKDGHHCLWGQRIDASSHRARGEPFALLHLHGRAQYRDGGWSAAGGRMAMVLAEDAGNIWMMSRSGAH
jgi:Tol biopolymer transport system component/DNA-binding winged helix-turn-helix (wHTH) protein